MFSLPRVSEMSRIKATKLYNRTIAPYLGKLVGVDVFFVRTQLSKPRSKYPKSVPNSFDQFPISLLTRHTSRCR